MNTLPLTPEVLARAYDYLSATAPFRSWNLPDSEDVVFRIVRCPRRYGWYAVENGKHVIAISSRNVGWSSGLIGTMAHEMVHLYQRDAQFETPGAQHNKAFRKLAARVCAIHGFDPKAF